MHPELEQVGLNFSRASTEKPARVVLFGQNVTWLEVNKVMQLNFMCRQWNFHLFLFPAHRRKRQFSSLVSHAVQLLVLKYSAGIASTGISASHWCKLQHPGIRLS